MTVARCMPLVVLALLCPGAAQAEPEVPLPSSPGMELAVADDPAFITSGPLRRQQAITAAKALGATRVRILVYERDTRPGKHQYEVLKQAVRDIRESGLKVMFTLTGDKQRFSPEYFGRFVGRIADDFRGLVDLYGVHNEPNLIGEFLPAANWRESATVYYWLYQAAYKAIKQADPAAKVLFGELSSASRPLDYFRMAVCRDEQWRPLSPRCQPVPLDGVAIHLYQMDRPPHRPDPRAPWRIGISSLDLLNRELAKAVESGAIVTPDGKLPRLYGSEFGYSSRGQLEYTRANLSPATRSRWIGWALDAACAAGNVVLLTQYELFSKSRHPPSAWDTSVMSRRGVPERLVFLAYRHWQLNHPECLANPLLDLPPLPVPKLPRR